MQFPQGQLDTTEIRHHKEQRMHRSPELLKDFHVITMISNPIRYETRYKLYEQWLEAMLPTGANIVTIELAYGARPFEITQRDNRNHVQLRSFDEIWHKENALNIAVNYICQQWPQAKYFAWIDADVFPMRPNQEWLLETFHQLQHYHVVQMFDTAFDCGPQWQIISGAKKGFVSEYVKNGCISPHVKGDSYYYGHGHPGFAWAATREALDWLGGLIDFGILGSGDRHMAMGLVGKILDSAPPKISQGYKNRLIQWQARATRHIQRQVGYVPGSIYHGFHGAKKFRQYDTRWRILVDYKYDPGIDLKQDAQGLNQLEVIGERQIQLRDAIHAYHLRRNEDDIRVE